MNRFLISGGKVTFVETVNNSFAEENSTDENLRKRVKRAVKNVVVSDELEAKILNLIGKKS